MRIVVADTGPLHYLVLIDAIDILPRLFEEVFVPEIVQTELKHSRTPPLVREWMLKHPSWLKSCVTPPVDDLPFPQLGGGERAAIALARAKRAELILMDDRVGVSAARGEGFDVLGTVGILDKAARYGMLDLAESFARLRATSFRCQQEIFDGVLAQYEADRIVS